MSDVEMIAESSSVGVYAGIGARRTPADVLSLMERVAGRLACAGWLLRSGGALGADLAFMTGADSAGGKAEVYLADGGYGPSGDLTPGGPSRAAFELAAQVHPAWDRCSPWVKALHARNGHQVLGADLDEPVAFVMCWTRDGSLDGSSRSAGGTGQALRIAARVGVPVFNLARPEHRHRVEDQFGRPPGD